MTSLSKNCSVSLGEMFIGDRRKRERERKLERNIFKGSLTIEHIKISFYYSLILSD